MTFTGSFAPATAPSTLDALARLEFVDSVGEQDDRPAGFWRSLAEDGDRGGQRVVDGGVTAGDRAVGRVDERPLVTGERCAPPAHSC